MKKMLLLLPLLLGSCLVKESELGGKTRLQWENQSSETLCSWSYMDRSGKWISKDLDSLAPGQKSIPGTLELWGKNPVQVRTCEGKDLELGVQEFNGHSLLWTLSGSVGTWKIQVKELSALWF